MWCLIECSHCLDIYRSNYCPVSKFTEQCIVNVNVIGDKVFDAKQCGWCIYLFEIRFNQPVEIIHNTRRKKTHRSSWIGPLRRTMWNCTSLMREHASAHTHTHTHTFSSTRIHNREFSSVSFSCGRFRLFSSFHPAALTQHTARHLHTDAPYYLFPSYTDECGAIVLVLFQCICYYHCQPIAVSLALTHSHFSLSLSLSQCICLSVCFCMRAYFFFLLFASYFCFEHVVFNPYE